MQQYKRRIHIAIDKIQDLKGRIDAEKKMDIFTDKEFLEDFSKLLAGGIKLLHKSGDIIKHHPADIFAARLLVNIYEGKSSEGMRKYAEDHHKYFNKHVKLEYKNYREDFLKKYRGGLADDTGLYQFKANIVGGELKKCGEHSEIGFFKTPPGKMITDYFGIASNANP